MAKTSHPKLNPHDVARGECISKYDEAPQRILVCDLLGRVEEIIKARRAAMDRPEYWLDGEAEPLTIQEVHILSLMRGNIDEILDIATACAEEPEKA